ncbi:MAG: L-rhamnose isomerase [Ruminococcaceae bacterium]|nr:L-rhamnose isomerase [Oscillospiraceae bacterium]
MSTEKRYELAREIYAELGVDTDAAIARASEIPVSIQCWQGDDLLGFETPDGKLTGGIQATGNYPGKARNIAELRADFEKAMSLIPGKKKLALHAIYLDNQGKKVERNEIAPEHFTSWVQWAKEQKIGLDFNPTFFSHPLSEDGFTLSHNDANIRNYWIEHGKASRKISEYLGKELGQVSVNNLWIPDGFKDTPVNRAKSRQILAESYAEIFSFDTDPKYTRDGMESKVFGIGAESCTIGSHEFYMGCAMKHQKLLTLDTGHFHPTEVVSDKISSVLTYLPGIALHVSRPVRWDSDHVVIFDDELKAIACEILRGGYEDRVFVGLDFFDASINRIACWTIGARSMQKAILWAALEPIAKLHKFEAEGDYTSRLAYLEEEKTYPFAAVWDYYCEKQGVPVRDNWVKSMKEYEQKVLESRK